MKKIFFGTLLLALVMVVPIPTMAGVAVNVGIALPPPIVFAAPPELVVLPETNVYVAPDVDVDIFFYGGWWWRPWEGRWYRSHYYDSGWGYYQGVPSFYAGIPSGWRNDYRNHSWKGHPWNYQRISSQQVQRHRGAGSQSRHAVKSQHRGAGSQSQHAVKSQHRGAGSQSRHGQPQHSQQHQGKHE